MLLDKVKRRAARLYHQYFHDFVFIHINKTGGSSIGIAFGIPIEHKTALEKRGELGNFLWSRKFSFTFVRNPWDKVVSHYHYRLKTNQTGIATDLIDFNQWVRLAYGENYPRYYDKPKMFMPQLNWITNLDGKIMVDFVGRFENLEQDFMTIGTRIDREAILPHTKKSDHGHYEDYYDDDTIQIVKEWFKVDIEQFGYQFTGRQ